MNTIALDKDVRINTDITTPEIRLVGIDGEALGIVSLTEAFAKAEELETDLVEIAPKAVPPVCRLMDYGKFKYAQSKKMHEARMKQKNVKVKEVKFRPGTDDGDYKVKLRNLISFLTDGDKTKVTLRFRGREIAHQQLGMALLKRVEADLEEYGVVEQFPKMEGRQMVMVLSPNKNPKKAKVKAVEEVLIDNAENTET
ncbi:MAG: translation initiation factor IF-3 [Methylophilaceae bacterium]